MTLRAILADTDAVSICWFFSVRHGAGSEQSPSSIWLICCEFENAALLLSGAGKRLERVLPERRPSWWFLRVDRVIEREAEELSEEGLMTTYSPRKFSAICRSALWVVTCFCLLSWISTTAFATDPEICCNGIDDDGDNLIDCYDYDCYDDDCCPSYELDCMDGLDGDNDGWIDCEDSDCYDCPRCHPERCKVNPDGSIDCTDCLDGTDNDCDGLIDHEEADCVCEVEACPGPNCDKCFDGYDNDCDGLTDDADPDCACVDEQCIPLPDGTADRSLCMDGIDNDCDGMMDDQEAACECDPECEICWDGLDNDNDGCVDCADEDCSNDACCNAYEICDDGLDNDGDYDVDCDDEDCYTCGCCHLGLTETNCTDGIDNDYDGCADCCDEDCFNVEPCVSDVIVPNCSTDCGLAAPGAGSGPGSGSSSAGPGAPQQPAPSSFIRGDIDENGG